MSLKDYHRKRDFKKTTEPRGRTARTATGDRFVVQKHDASRLHYDFRLELDGVLKSWAVPKGPSLDPADKRLAVHVEDHPVDYGDFEGVIPEGYGAGTVLLWDRGRWHPRDKDPRKAYREGHLKFDLEGEKLRGGWMLVRMSGERGDDGRNWLLVKEQDAAARRGKAGRITDHEPASVETGRDINQVAAAKDRQWRSNRETADPDRKQKELRKQTTGRAADAAPRTKKAEPPDPARVKGARRGPLPADPRPQLTTLVAQPPRGDGWLHEIKYDGYRILARLEHGRARLLSRNGKDWTARFEAIATALRELEVDDALLDGEVVVLDEKGVSSFQQLQNFTRQGKQAELCYYVFDLLHLNGYDLRRAGQLERKELVRRLLVRAGRKGRVRFSDHVRGGGDEVLDNACRLGLEGIISKKADAPYAERRTRSWVKLKCGRRQEFVIAGYTDPGGSRAGFGALVLGYYDEGGRLIYCGRVGTGFSDRVLKRMHEDLRRRERRQSPFDRGPKGADARGVHYVAPELVAEVAFTEWTDEGILRHPSFQGLREDKQPKDVRRERPAATAADNGRARAGAPARRNRATESDEDMIAGVTLTNPERVLYPEQGLTKRQIAQFYVDIADWVLPYVVNRPLSIVRCPAGRQKHCFYQKHVNDTVHPAVSGVEVQEKDGPKQYLMITGLEGLVALVQMGVLEIHPWGARADRVDRPDLLVFDLDPDPAVGWEAVVTGARLMHDRLEELGLRSFLKTSGGKGLHVCMPIERRTSWDDVKAFCRALAESITADDPAHYIATMSKARRKGRIFIDYLRNARGATSVAAYSTRARPGAPVSAPIRWDELTADLSPSQYTVENLRDRLNALKQDPWDGFFDVRQSITAGMQRKLGMK